MSWSGLDFVACFRTNRDRQNWVLPRCLTFSDFLLFSGGILFRVLLPCFVYCKDKTSLSPLTKTSCKLHRRKHLQSPQPLAAPPHADVVVVSTHFNPAGSGECKHPAADLGFPANNIALCQTLILEGPFKLFNVFKVHVRKHIKHRRFTFSLPLFRDKTNRNVRERETTVAVQVAVFFFQKSRTSHPKLHRVSKNLAGKLCPQQFEELSTSHHKASLLTMTSPFPVFQKPDKVVLRTGSSITEFNCARSTQTRPQGHPMIEKQGSSVMILLNDIDKIRCASSASCSRGEQAWERRLWVVEKWRLLHMCVCKGLSRKWQKWFLQWVLSQPDLARACCRAISAYFCDNRSITVNLWFARTQFNYTTFWHYVLPPPEEVPGVRQVRGAWDRCVGSPRGT